MSKRRFTREFKLTAVRRMQIGESVARLARELEVGRRSFTAGITNRRSWGQAPFWARDTSWPSADRMAELERKIGQQALEIDFLKRALQRVEEQRQLRALAGGARSTNKSNGKCSRGTEV